MTIPFGKHKGESVDSLPSSYLVWLYESDIKLEYKLQSAIKNELDFRFSLPKYIEPSTNIRSIYIDMCKKYHPDKGGSNSAMQAINDFYNKLTNG
jgi:hypothetical protein